MEQDGDQAATLHAMRSIERSKTAFDLRRYDQSLREAQAATVAMPSYWFPFVLQAQALLALERHEEALVAVDSAINRAPTSPTSHRIRARVLLAQSRFALALASVDESIRLAPVESSSHITRSEVLHQLGRLKEAVAAAEHALTLSPKDRLSLDQLGRVLLDVEPGRSETLFRQALTDSPNDAQLLNNLGVALERQGRLQEAASLYKSAVLADPTLTVARQNAHGAVSKWTLVVGGGLAVAGKAAVGSNAITGIVAANIARLSAPSGLATFVLVLVVVVAIVAGGVMFERRRRMRALKSEDPQLHAMFEKLDADAKTGRL